MTQSAPTGLPSEPPATPTVYDLARMSEAVYQDDASSIYAASIPEPPIRRPDAALDCIDLVDKDGFGAAIYRDGDVHTITYRGTKNAPHDIHDTTGRLETPPQFVRATQYALDAIDRLGLTPEVTCFTGHSLGGALAKYVAHNLARKGWGAGIVVSFNAPGLTVNMLEKVLVNGILRLSEGTPVALGLRAVDRLIREKDLPQKGQTAARILNVNVQGDTVSQIGDSAGMTYTLIAPPFVLLTDPKLVPPLGNPYVARARAVRLRLQYLHSIHTVRRLLEDDALGRQSALNVFGPPASLRGGGQK
ncbi:hypothetical protein [uncultured Marivita sp.]|uniref:hypothetical protein n=1 Tax=uncultured Marivita sp. TaxID=888080 RepID=UPI00261F6BCA|nr:hypothetical protein [uncultured Marivita sp.]